MSKEEGIRRMKVMGQLFTVTGIAVPLMSFVIWQLGGRAAWELCIFTLPLWALMFVAGAAMWVTAYIKEGYLE
jgi:hypothetical protein